MRLEDLTEAQLGKLPPDVLRYHIWQEQWLDTARPNQIPPDGDWTECGYMAGRGFGKTRVGAEWLAAAAIEDPDALDRAVIAPTYGDVKFTCFQGPAGLLKVIPPELVENYNSTDLIVQVRTLSGKIGTIRGFTAEKPERLRGPQHADIWCFAAGTPVLMADGSERPIESITTGALVATRFGARRVTAAGRSGNDKPRVRLVYGATSLIATSDHPMLTSRGWVAAGGLQEGDELWSACGLRAFRGGSGPMATTHTGDRAGISTARCTSKPAALSLLGTTCITATETLRTITQTIWRFCRAANTGASTPQVRPRRPSSALSCWPTANGLGMLCRRAMSRAANAAKSFRRAAGESPGLFAARSVWNAGDLTLSPASAGFAGVVGLSSTPPRHSRCSAPGGVTTMLIGRLSTEAPSLAPIAAPSSCPSEAMQSFANGLALSPVRVESVERLPTLDPVYDLTVEGVHEFIAGGVVVHNCDELAAWQYAQDTWDMALMGLRLGHRPRILWTTTPKPIELVRRLTEPKPTRVLVRGSTYDNKANLPQSFFDQLAQFEGTVIGRQELEGELIDPEESGVIKRSWLRLWPAKKNLPVFDWIVLSLDTAFTEATTDRKSHDPDYSACAVFGGFRHKVKMPDGSIDERAHVLLLDCWQEQLGLPELVKRVKRELNVAYGDDGDTALIKPLIGSSKPVTSGRKPDIVVIEDKGSGISLRQVLDREGIASYAYNPGRADKLTRLHIVSPVFARRQVWLPESDKFPGRARTWTDDLVHQLCSFTGRGSLKHDDYVDCCSQALRLMMDKGMLSAVKAKPEIREPAPPRTVVNPYAA